MKKISPLFKNVFIYSFTNLLIKSAVFLLLPLYSHFVSPGNFGVYSLLLAGYTIITSLYQGGFQSAFSKFYLDSKNDDEKHRVASQFFSMTLLISFFIALLGFVSAKLVSVYYFGNENYAEIIRVLSFTLLFDNFYTCGLHFFKTREQAKPVIIYSVVPAIFNVFLSVVFLVVNNSGIVGIANAQFLALVIVSMILFPKISRHVSFRIDPTNIKPFLRFAFPLLLAGGLTALTDLVDRFILRAYFDDAAVGIYSFAYRIASVMNMFVLSFRAAWTPHSMQMFKREDYGVHFGKSFSKLLFLGLLIFLSVSLLMPYVFHLQLTNHTQLFNPLYGQGLVILPIILLAYFFNGLVSFFSVYPYVSGKSYHFLISDAIALFINITTNLLLIPKFGFIGAAVATLISYFFSVCYLYSISFGKVQVVLQIKKVIFIASGALLLYFVGMIYNNISVNIVLLMIYIFFGVRTIGVNLLLPKQAK